jgi:hypothetical protein
MRYVIEFTREPAALAACPAEGVAESLAAILNKDLEFYWDAQVTVTTEGN